MGILCAYQVSSHTDQNGSHGLSCAKARMVPVLSMILAPDAWFRVWNMANHKHLGIIESK